jgi:hypothetical protein
MKFRAQSPHRAPFSCLRAIGAGLKVAWNAITSDGFEAEYE